MLTGDWYEYKDPFTHYKAFNVLPLNAYGEITALFKKLLADTEKNAGETTYKLKSGIKNYDALILGMNKELGALFTPFFTKEWLKSMADFLQIPYIPRVEGGLHSHPLHSRTGWIHTDFCSAYFDESKVTDHKELLFPDRKMCEYFTGKMLQPTAKPVEYVRAATMIFYLCNDNWKKGNGGETAIYGASVQGKQTAVELIAPVNNSLILFECSPHSYHRFITNPYQKRNSLILWIHTTAPLAEQKWGKSIDRV